MSGGQLGTGRNTGFMDPGTSALTGHSAPGSTFGPTLAEIDQYAMAAARNLLTAVGGVDTHGAIGYFLGDKSFTAGVIVGMGQNLVGTAVELVKFVKMLALADYYQAQHVPGFWNKFGRQLTPMGFVQAPVHSAMALVGHFWPAFDHEAQEAYEEREALFETVKYAFTHPGEVFDSLTDAQVKRYEEFERYRAQHTLAGEFHAGVLFGELVIDLLMLVAAVAGLAKLIARIPRLAKLLPRLRRLVPTLTPPVKAGPLGLPKVEPPSAAKADVATKAIKRPTSENPLSKASSYAQPKSGVASNAAFASESKLNIHFEKHGAEFGAKNPSEYLQVGRDIMQKGTKVEYMYKGEVRAGYTEFMGNSGKGVAKFGFVGTNAEGAITTIHVESGNSFWKMLNGDSATKIIRPAK